MMTARFSAEILENTEGNVLYFGAVKDLGGGRGGFEPTTMRDLTYQNLFHWPLELKGLQEKDEPPRSFDRVTNLLPDNYSTGDIP